ncbi:MAG: hypothetical protein WBA44_01985 [Mesorhizobium sp.]
MFARRFTIVSLMTVLFGLVMANIVAGAGRERAWKNDSVVICQLAQGLTCGTARF